MSHITEEERAEWQKQALLAVNASGPMVIDARDFMRLLAAFEIAEWRGAEMGDMKDTAMRLLESCRHASDVATKEAELWQRRAVRTRAIARILAECFADNAWCPDNQIKYCRKAQATNTAAELRECCTLCHLRAANAEFQRQAVAVQADGVGDVE